MHHLVAVILGLLWWLLAGLFGLPAAPAEGPPDLVGRVVHAESGEPLAGVTVAITGSGGRSTVTAADGSYRLSPGPGAHQLTAGAGNPCVVPERGRRVELPDAGDDVEVDVRLVTRTDGFGYGCTASPATWIDTSGGEHLEPVGGGEEKPLPFGFPYYGHTYDRITLGGAGRLIIGPAPNRTSTGDSPILPDPYAKGAILVLGAQLTAKGDPSATYRADAHRLTVTWARYRFDWSDRTVTAQLQLSDDGTIDLLYGDVDVITPTTALTIGFESPDGSDAFTFAHRDLPSLSHTAWRFRPVATAAAAGVVRNANDGLLLAGATVTADPGGRSTITDKDGRYRLALLPGTYALSASAPSSGTAAAPVTASGDATSPVPDLVLPAPDARVLLEPPGDGIDLSVSAGGRRVAGFTLANDGDRPLEWAIHERDDATAPVAPPPAGLPWTPVAARAVPLGFLAADPPEDTGGLHVLYGGSDGHRVRLRVDLSGVDSLTMSTLQLYLDTDHDPTTGVTTTNDRRGNPRPLGLGADACVAVGGGFAPPQLAGHLAAPCDKGFGVDVPVTLADGGLTLDLPLAAPGPVDVIARVVNHHGIEGDRIPDASAATILPELDAPWLDTPRAGVVPPGSTAWLYVWIGQLTRRGTYRAELRIETDDPRHPTMRVPVTVHVT